MKLILQSGNTVDWPKSPNDITLAQYIRYHNDVLPTIPKEVIEYDALIKQLQDIEKELEKYYKESGAKSPHDLRVWLNEGNPRNNAKRFLPALLEQWEQTVKQMEEMAHVNDSLWISQQWHPYQLRVVKALTVVDEELTVDQLRYLFQKCTAAILQPKEIHSKQLYYHDGVTHTLPDELMKNSTLIEFAEAAQYESALKQAQGGDATGLLKMCAVLLKPVGEAYSEELFERNVLALQTLPLQVAHEVAFFLTWLSSKYALSLNHSILRGAVREMQN